MLAVVAKVQFNDFNVQPGGLEMFGTCLQPLTGSDGGRG